MAKHYNFIAGGTLNPVYPNHTGEHNFGAPYSRAIAFEDASGFRTASAVLNTKNSARLHALFPNDTLLAVGDTIDLMVIPEGHFVDTLFARVDKADVRVAGLRFRAKFQAVDMDTGADVTNGAVPNDQLDIDPSQELYDGTVMTTNMVLPKGVGAKVYVEVMALPTTPMPVRLMDFVMGIGVHARSTRMPQMR